MPYISGRYYPLRRIIFFLGEGVLIFIATYWVNLYVASRMDLPPSQSLELMRSGVVTLVFLLSLYFFDLYDLNVYSSFSLSAPRITQAFGCGCIALAGIYYVIPALIIPTRYFLIGYALICLFLAVWRGAYILLVGRHVFATPILLIGSGELAAKICAELHHQVDASYDVKVVIGEENEALALSHAVFRRDMENLPEICREYAIEQVVVALDDRRGTTPVKELISCKLDGLEINNGIGFFEELTGKIMVEQVNPDWIIYSPGFSIGRFGGAMKRVTDIILALIGLLLAAPFMLITAIAIKIESPGPVFYLQERVGLRGRVFKVIKFRSMRQDAEKDGAVWAMKNDTRVTRVGAFIRKVRIDELPQLWNVLKGEMSFVGPRPERPIFVTELEEKIPYYSLRHNIMPGVTGWAQVCYPYGASVEDALRKLEYDLYYLKNVSFSMDLWIVFQTVKTVLFGKGAR